MNIFQRESIEAIVFNKQLNFESASVTITLSSLSAIVLGQVSSLVSFTELQFWSKFRNTNIPLTRYDLSDVELISYWPLRDTI